MPFPSPECYIYIMHVIIIMLLIITALALFLSSRLRFSSNSRSIFSFVNCSVALNIACRTSSAALSWSSRSSANQYSASTNADDAAASTARLTSLRHAPTAADLTDFCDRPATPRRPGATAAAGWGGGPATPYWTRAAADRPPC